MRTAIIIGIGLVAMLVCIGVARWIGAGTNTGARVFWGLWLVAAGVNMWIGVSRAGYAFKDEFPIFLLIFLIPAVAAWLVRWKWP
jgi:hypothetical protein